MARSVVSAGSGGGVSITLSPPLEFIMRQSGRFRQQLANLEPLWERFKPIMGEIEAQRFAEAGPGWAPLAESTIRQKAAAGYPLDPLIRTGALRDSLTQESAAAKTTRLTMEWGSGVDYAKYHQEGTPRMPQRKVIDIDVDARRRFEMAMVGWINLVARDTFGRI
jgi:hypothetical protein